MEITLRVITPENWRQCIALQVEPHQEKFVASNIYSLAEARVFPESIPLAIYAGETMVGFLMYDFDPSDGTPWINRMMIDRAYQGRGYGRAALQEAILRIEAQSERDEIKISFEPDNEVAEHLYRSMGFEDTDEMIDDEQVMRLKLR